MKFIKSFKSIFSHLRSFTKDDLTTLMDACNDDDIDTIDKLFKKKTKINPIPIQSILSAVAIKGSADMMHYFLTSKNTLQFQQPDVSLNKCLESAAIYNHLDLIKYLLTLPDHIPNHMPHDKENIVLDYLAQLLYFDSIDFLINSPLFEGKIDLHTNKDILFVQAYNNRKDDFLEYLIFDRKLEKTLEIDNFLNSSDLHRQNDPYLIHIKKMFQTRDLKIELKNELKINLGDIKKKIKI